MAQYRFSPDIVSRGAGQSAIAKAAYNAREDIRDERTGEVKRQADRDGVEFSGIFAPKNAPAWMQDRAKLWNAIELQEDGTTRRATAQLARSLELNLPHELNADQRKQLVRDFVREQFVRQGMVADVAIHRPHQEGDQRNYHAHILLTLREIDGDGFSTRKARQWNDKALNLQWREKWAELGARYLENAGHAQEAERYSYGHFDKEKQRSIALERGDHEHATALEGPATAHKGPHIVEMERRLDMTTERGQEQRERFTAAQETAKLKIELAAVEKQIAVAVQDMERATQAPRVQRTTPRQTPPPQTRAVPANTNRREVWMEHSGGFAALPERLQPKAQRDFDHWKNDGKGRGTSHGIESYVTYVQERWNAGQRPAFRDTKAEIAERPLTKLGRGSKAIGRFADRSLTKGVSIGASVLGALSNAIESLFAPPKPLTRTEAAEERKRQRAAANDQDRAFEHYARETEHERSQARQHDEAQKRQIEREQYERLERGGRER